VSLEEKGIYFPYTQKTQWRGAGKGKASDTLNPTPNTQDLAISPDACSKSVMENRQLEITEKRFVAQK
jgi:hypothetical protein